LLVKEETYIYPNPVRNKDEVTLRFALSQRSQVEFYIYDLSGKEVTYINFGEIDAGNEIEKSVSIKNLAVGVYFWKLVARSKATDEKRVIIKKLGVIR
jgi:hypothetical protein